MYDGCEYQLPYFLYVVIAPNRDLLPVILAFNLWTHKGFLLLIKEYALWEEPHGKPLPARSLATHQHFTSIIGMGERKVGDRIEEMRRAGDEKPSKTSRFLHTLYWGVSCPGPHSNVTGLMPRLLETAKWEWFLTVSFLFWGKRGSVGDVRLSLASMGHG